MNGMIAGVAGNISLHPLEGDMSVVAPLIEIVMLIRRREHFVDAGGSVNNKDSIETVRVNGTPNQWREIAKGLNRYADDADALRKLFDLKGKIAAEESTEADE